MLYEQPGQARGAGLLCSPPMTGQNAKPVAERIINAWRGRPCTPVCKDQTRANARCWLKNAIPEPSANSCCVSGIERQAVATPTQPSLPQSLQPRFDINLLGSDYRQFALDADEWAQCRSACKAESACLAWTFVRPGVQGPRAHCRLKNKIPPPTPNSCCISGIERTEVR